MQNCPYIHKQMLLSIDCYFPRRGKALRTKETGRFDSWPLIGQVKRAHARPKNRATLPASLSTEILHCIAIAINMEHKSFGECFFEQPQGVGGIVIYIHMVLFEA